MMAASSNDWCTFWRKNFIYFLCTRSHKIVEGENGDKVEQPMGINLSFQERFRVLKKSTKKYQRKTKSLPTAWN